MIMDHNKNTTSKNKNSINNRFVIEKYKQQIVEIIEGFLDQDHQADLDKFLNQDCHLLCKNYYDDLVVERSIVFICGYVGCSNKLNPEQYKPKQNYHISSSRVLYDISKRRMFCSNKCYKGSVFLREQIYDEAIWLRPEIDYKKRFCLYQDDQGLCGDVIRLKRDVIKDEENEKENDQEKKHSKTVIKHAGFPYIKKEQLEQLKNQMENLKIDEKDIDSTFQEPKS